MDFFDDTLTPDDIAVLSSENSEDMQPRQLPFSPEEKPLKPERNIELPEQEQDLPDPFDPFE